jgi:hypothetical protein
MEEYKNKPAHHPVGKLVFTILQDKTPESKGIKHQKTFQQDELQ